MNTTTVAAPAAVSDPSPLAAIGREMGLQLCRFTNAGATCYGVRDPLRDTVLTVTGFSCACPRFVVRGACPHHAFLLDALGWTAAGSAILWCGSLEIVRTVRVVGHGDGSGSIAFARVVEGDEVVPGHPVVEVPLSADTMAGLWLGLVAISADEPMPTS